MKTKMFCTEAALLKCGEQMCKAKNVELDSAEHIAWLDEHREKLIDIQIPTWDGKFNEALVAEFITIIDPNSKPTKGSLFEFDGDAENSEHSLFRYVAKTAAHVQRSAQKPDFTDKAKKKADKLVASVNTLTAEQKATLLKALMAE